MKKYHDAILTTMAVVWGSTDWGKVASRYALDLYDFLGGEPNLKTIKTGDLDAWLASYPDDKSSTSNRRLAAVSKVFTVARQRGYEGPVPYFPRKKEPAHKVRWLTREEEATLAHKLLLAEQPTGSHAYETMVILIDTGMRLGEFYRLQMADVDWDTGLITIRESKSGRSRSIPMTNRVKNILNTEYPKLPYEQREPEFRACWEKARKVMGMRPDPSFTPHVLRHTCASRLVQSGVPLKVIQEWLGHSSITMTMRYAHLAPQSLQVAVDALEEYNEDIR